MKISTKALREAVETFYSDAHPDEAVVGDAVAERAFIAAAYALAERIERMADA